MPSIVEANASEAILLPLSSCRPRVTFGCTLDEALGGMGGTDGGTSSGQAALLEQLVQLYAGERYMLNWHGGAACVLLQEEARPQDLLRAMWQAAWLEQAAQQQQHRGTQAAAADTAAEASIAAVAAEGSSGNGSGPPPPAVEKLAASLAAMRQQWPDFEAQAAAQGWQLEKAVLPRGRTLLRLE